MRFCFLLFTVFFLFLSACGRDALIPKDVFSPETSSAMLEKLDIIQTRDVGAILANALAEVQKVDEVESALEKAIDYLPEGRSSYELINAQTNISNVNGTTTKIYIGTYELTNGVEFAIIQLALQKTDACCLIRNIQINSYENSPSRAHDWSWDNKPITSYGVFGLVIVIPLFILLTLIHCWRNEGVVRKWRWRLFIVFGLYGLMLNWTTGAITPNFININAETGAFNFSILQLNLFGAGVTRSSVLQPWIINLGFPLGAIMYWWKKKRGSFEVESDAVDLKLS